MGLGGSIMGRVLALCVGNLSLVPGTTYGQE